MIGQIIRRSIIDVGLRKGHKLLQYPIRRAGNVIGTDSGAYDGDGKTTVRNLNAEELNLNLINTYSDRGFRLSNGLFVVGSLIVFPVHGVYSWAIKDGSEITPESLIIFDLITPKIKVLVIGYGDQDQKHDLALPLLLKKKGISCEYLPTPHAVTTYNFLATDSVPVAGAFVPVKKLQMTLRDHQGLNMQDALTDSLRSNEVMAEADARKFQYNLERLDDTCRDNNKKSFD